MTAVIVIGGTSRRGGPAPRSSSWSTCTRPSPFRVEQIASVTVVATAEKGFLPVANW